MTVTEEYKEHIEHTFHAYCKIVIRHAAIDAARERKKRLEREISLEYLMESKHYPFSTIDRYFAEPEEVQDYPVFLCGTQVVLSSKPLFSALSKLPKQTQEMLYLRFFLGCTYKEIGLQFQRNRRTVSRHIKQTLHQLQKEMEGYYMRNEK